MTNSKALREWIAERGFKLKYVAQMLGITPYSLQKKIDNETEFKVSEIAVFTDILGMSGKTRDAIFFPACRIKRNKECINEPITSICKSSIRGGSHSS